MGGACPSQARARNHHAGTHHSPRRKHQPVKQNLSAGRYTPISDRVPSTSRLWEPTAMILSRKSIIPLSVGAALALSGCETTGSGPVQVTRFHLAQPIAPGSFVVEQGAPAGPTPANGPDSLESKDYNDIVGGELGRLGFTSASGIADAELVVTVNVDRGTREDYRASGSGVSLGIGGGSFGRRSGFGVGTGVSFPVGNSQSRYLVGTRLRVQIKRRSEGSVIWEGRAMTEARASAADSQPSAAVAKLAHALFQGFPGESGRTITVK